MKNDLLEIHHGKALKGAYALSQDPDQVMSALFIASMARGRTEFRGVGKPTPLIAEFIEILHHTVTDITFKENLWELEGQGIHGIKNTGEVFHVSDYDYNVILMLAHFSRKPEQPWFLRGTPERLEYVKDMFLSLLPCQVHVKNDDLLELIFEPCSIPTEPVKSANQKPVPLMLKIFWQIQALTRQKEICFEEKTSHQDTFFRMLKHFGLPLDIQITGEELSDMEKRLARMRGIKPERKTVTLFQPVHAISAQSVICFGDFRQAAVLALAATLIPGSDITLENVFLNSSRSGFLNALRRMGADVEVKKRSEKQNDISGTLRVKYTRRLVGRRFNDEITMGMFDEIPLLATAAAFAEGETILRLSESQVKKDHSLLEALMANLREAGVDIGIYEEGLVIRGREECDSSSFDGSFAPLFFFASLVLASAAHGTSSLPICERAITFYPGLLEQLLPGASDAVE